MAALAAVADLFEQPRQDLRRRPPLHNVVTGDGVTRPEARVLSVGGGTSPGMPKQNILAMLEALEQFNGKRLAQV